MMALSIALVASALLCGMVAGFLFAFAVVAMPGIGALDDRAFLRAFQVMDGVIQRGHPLFGVVWLGSIVAVVAAMILGVGHLTGVDRGLLLAAGLTYLFGAQLPTVVVNIPMNNRVQTLDLDSSDDETVRTARGDFEARWNRWNAVRTVVATVATATLLIVLVRLG